MGFAQTSLFVHSAYIALDVHGPNILCSLYSVGCGFYRCAMFATCCSIITRERTQASTRRDTTVHLIPYPSLTCYMHY